jgi:hypothetical protein
VKKTKKEGREFSLVNLMIYDKEKGEESVLDQYQFAYFVCECGWMQRKTGKLVKSRRMINGLVG